MHIEPAAIAAQVAAEPMPEEPPAFPRQALPLDEEPAAAPLQALSLDAEAPQPLQVLPLEGKPAAASPAPAVAPAEPAAPESTEPEPALAVLPEHAPEPEPEVAADRGPPATPIAARSERTTVDIEDPLALIETGDLPARPAAPSPWRQPEGELIAVEVDAVGEEVPELGAGALEVIEEGAAAEDDGIEVSVEEAAVPTIVTPPPPPPKPASAPAKPAAPPPPTPARPVKGKSIDLGEIDALLADIDSQLAKK
jgi:hypothetical protein